MVLNCRYWMMLVVFLLVLSSCGSIDEEKVKLVKGGALYSIYANSTGVFVTGVTGYSIPPYAPYSWSNNVVQALPINSGIEGGYAAALTVYSGDVYVAGYYVVEGVVRACYWKNGTRVALPAYTTGYDAVANAIYVDSTGIYVGGYAKNSVGVALPYSWKDNGSITGTLLNQYSTSEAAAVLSIYVSGGVVYSAGYVTSNSIMLPCTWTGSSFTYLSTDVAQGGVANSLVYTGGNLYAAGYCKNGNKIANPVYWVNAVRTDLTVTDSSLKGGSANSIIYDSGNLYIGGREVTTAAKPCYWYVASATGNGVKTMLSAPSAGGRVYSIMKNGSDIYAAGLISGSDISMPAYWVNGVRTDLAIP